MHHNLAYWNKDLTSVNSVVSITFTLCALDKKICGDGEVFSVATDECTALPNLGKQG